MKLEPKQAGALATVTIASIELDHLEQRRSNALAARNHAIQDALAMGLPLRQVARHAGISNPAVHKIRYLKLAARIATSTNLGRDENGATPVETGEFGVAGN